MRANVLALCLVAGVSAAHAAPMQPYQMVRSLQLVQDRIANGDHAALPMQSKLLEIIDDRFLHADTADFGDKKNFRAIFVYAMSGGNPVTVRTVLAKLDLDDTDRKLSRGIVDYMQGAFGPARKNLEDVDPMQLSPEIGAFMALLKGAVLVHDEPEQAMKLFDTARLLSPGTLVEEAALRRSVGVAAALGDAPHFTEDAWRYVSRYLHSPYASQFAEDFVSGVLALRTTIDLQKVSEIVAGMSREQGRFIYLRLARQSAIDGYDDLLAFASAKVTDFDDKTPGKSDPRALLYSSIASVSAENVDDIRRTLEGIDASRLSPGDQRLLEAARAVAGEVVSLPDTRATEAPSAEQVDGTVDKDRNAVDGLVPEPVAASTPAVEVVSVKSAPAAAENAGPPKQPAPAGEAAFAKSTLPAAAATPYLSAARDKLEAIDKLLETSPQ